MQHTSEQKDIICCSDSSFRVLAGAGSGKTSTMAYFVESEIKSGRIRGDEICFITFTRFAAEQIKTKIRNIVGPNHGITCGTFHSTMFKLLHHAGLTLPEGKGLYDARMEEGVTFFISLMEKRNPSLVKVLQKYKCLIIDEFQDLDDTQFEFTKLFKQIVPSIHIIGVGDLAQNIYRFRGTSNEFLRTRLQNEVEPSLKTFTLTTNFRSTGSILNLVNTMFSHEIRDKKILPMYLPANGLQGNKPEYFEYALNPGKGLGEYEMNIVDTLLPIILEAKTMSKSVVLIFPIIKCQSFQIITSLLRNRSKQMGFSFDLHQIAKEDETCSTVAFKYDPKDNRSPIQCSSFHSSKGLEWDIVALINVDDSMYNVSNYEDDLEAHEAEKTNLLYVGVTRPIERLLIFANANMGGRHRLLARLGDSLETVLSFTQWGTEEKLFGPPKKKPIGVKDLIRKLPQHPDLYKRIMKCSEHISSKTKDGERMIDEHTYDEMKQRNRELAFGTFIDWRLKRALCKGESKNLQDCLIELMINMNKNNWFHNSEALEDVELRLAKLDVFFMNAEVTPNSPLIHYIIPSRWMALHRSRSYAYVEECRDMVRETENIIKETYNKPVKNIKDEYILSQARDFFVKGSSNEISAVYSPRGLYMGLPHGFDDFLEYNSGCIVSSVHSCIATVGATIEHLSGDIPFESDSMIIGEGDMYTEECGGVLIEIKCNSSHRAIDLRDSGNCKNLLQVLTYVALARHGTIPREIRSACIINPLTGAWEMYDLDTWSHDESDKFMDCLEELREMV